jgi:hypothetical protein
MATIDPISEDIEWSAKAALADAANRVDHKSPVVAIWLDENGMPHWTHANCEFKDKAAILAYMNAMVLDWAKIRLDA